MPCNPLVNKKRKDKKMSPRDEEFRKFITNVIDLSVLYKHKQALIKQATELPEDSKESVITYDKIRKLINKMKETENLIIDVMLYLEKEKVLLSTEKLLFSIIKIDNKHFLDIAQVPTVSDLQDLINIYPFEDQNEGN